jgi:sugar-specific transcriptional regulator TrmB
MNTSILVEAGLTDAEANAYTFLAQNSPIAPPRLAELINESRTNTYKLLESLEELGLAQKDESDKKIKYWAKNPNALLEHVNKEKEQADLKAKKLQSSLPSLVNDFLKYNEQPGVRFYQGKTGIKEIFEDQLRCTNGEVYYFRSLNDVIDFDEEELHKIRNKFVEKNIHRYGITQDHKSKEHLLPQKERIPIAESDKAMKLHRTWIKEEDYTAPVEWASYGDKVSIISFGEEIIGTVIESKQIAESFRQIFKLLEKSISSIPEYKKLPVNVTHTRLPESFKTI